MYCENCGEKLPEDAKFCPKCGHKIKPNLPSIIIKFYNRWNQWSGSKKISSLLILCLCVLILVNGIAITKLMYDVDAIKDNHDDDYSYVSYDDNKYTTGSVEDNPSSTESSYSYDKSDDSKTKHSSSDYGSSSSGGSYVGSVNSNKFHIPSCGQASKIKSGNLITFSSRDDAISRGYSPCKFCNS